MAQAYLYAEGAGPQPEELDALRAIWTFGVAGAWGRPLGVGEMRRMLVAELIVKAHRQRSQHPEGWAAWAKEHRHESELLNTAARIVEEYSNGE
jgi:hypothetical protein